jgi:hypothetical protein
MVSIALMETLSIFWKSWVTTFMASPLPAPVIRTGAQ